MLLFFAAVASAQDVPDAPDINAQRFHSSVDGPAFWLDDSHVSAQALSLRALLHYAMDPLQYELSNGETLDIISDLAQLDLAAGYGLGPVRLGVLAPVYLLAADINGAAAGFGDLAVDLRWEALDREAAPVGLGLVGRLVTPTSTVTGLGGGGVGWELGGVVDAQLGPILLAANLGTRGVPQTVTDGLTVDDQLSWRLGGTYSLAERTGLSLEFAGDHTYNDLLNPAGTPIDGMLGAYVRPTNSPLVLRAGVGAGLTEGIGAAKLRAVVAVGWEQLPDRDLDDDGILDRGDSCPDRAEDIDAWLDTDGCPEPTQVSLKIITPAGEAVPDARLTVQDTVHAGPVTLNLEPGDYTLTATAANYEEKTATLSVPNGPPLERVVVMRPFGRIIVRIYDEKGQPIEATVAVGGEQAGTGPVSGSTVERSFPGGNLGLLVTREGYQTSRQTVVVNAGEITEIDVRLLPAKAVLDTQRKRIDIRDTVYFEVNRAEIKPESYPLLDEIAQLLLDHPEILLVRIEGHTDSRGNDAHNLQLSKERATAVRNYLISKGVSADRLESEGYGELKPLVRENNERAWALNRRVDFFVVKQAQ